MTPKTKLIIGALVVVGVATAAYLSQSGSTFQGSLGNIALRNGNGQGNVSPVYNGANGVAATPGAQQEQRSVDNRVLPAQPRFGLTFVDPGANYHNDLLHEGTNTLTVFSIDMRNRPAALKRLVMTMEKGGYVDLSNFHFFRNNQDITDSIGLYENRRDIKVAGIPSSDRTSTRRISIIWKNEERLPVDRTVTYSLEADASNTGRGSYVRTFVGGGTWNAPNGPSDAGYMMACSASCFVEPANNRHDGAYLKISRTDTDHTAESQLSVLLDTERLGAATAYLLPGNGMLSRTASGMGLRFFDPNGQVNGDAFAYIDTNRNKAFDLGVDPRFEVMNQNWPNLTAHNGTINAPLLFTDATVNNYFDETIWFDLNYNGVVDASSDLQLIPMGNDINLGNNGMGSGRYSIVWSDLSAPSHSVNTYDWWTTNVSTGISRSLTY